MILLILYTLLRHWMAGRRGTLGCLLADMGRRAAVRYLAAAVLPAWAMLLAAALELFGGK